MANAGARSGLPASVTGARQKPNIPVSKPASRHYIMQIGKASPSRPGDRNTVIEPWVDVQADIDAINRGEGIVDKQRATAWVNGRLYGFHSDTGTAWPISGDGFVRMDQKQYSAFKKVAQYNGLNERSEKYLHHEPNLTDADRALVRRLWRWREQAKANE